MITALVKKLPVMKFFVIQVKLVNSSVGWMILVKLHKLHSLFLRPKRDEIGVLWV